MKKILNFCLLVVLFVNLCKAEKLSLPDTQANITAIADDGENLWIGTDKGLVRFNRLKKKYFNLNMENSVLPSNLVTSVCVSADKNIWIGTPKGLVRYDRYAYLLLTKENSGLPDNYISAIVESPESGLWIGTKKGLVKTSKHFNKYKVFTIENSLMANNCIVSLSMDMNGTVWAGILNSGVAKIENGHWQIYNKSNSGLAADNILFVTKEKDGKYYFGTFENGILASDGSNFSPVLQNYTDLKFKKYRAFKSTNNQWIYTLDGTKQIFFLDSNNLLSSSQKTDLLLFGFNCVY